MAVCVASASAPASWASLPTARSTSTPLRRTSATWNTKFPAGLDLDLSLPAAAPASTPIFFTTPAPKPRLRLPLAPATSTTSCRFDPFADDDEPPVLRAAPTSQENTLPSRGRPLTPLTISSPLPIASSSTPAPAPPARAPTPAPTGRRRAPSFSAGSGVRVSLPLSALSSLSSLSALPSPAPSLSLSRPLAPASRPTPAVAAVPGAPSPFHARHYPTPDARARLLARTLLHRINSVGRPRSLYSCSSYSRMTNGYESECGARAYVPSRLSECVVAAC